MAEDEININDDQPVSLPNKMEAHHGSVEIENPNMSNEELLDVILNAPSEKLIPWEECTLPSMGYYYGWQDGVVKVRAMGQKAEKILATQRLAASGQSIDYLFRECCKFPENFDPAELLLGDRVFLLYFLRGITHGNMYEFAVECPNPECGATQTYSYDLNGLAATIKPANRALGKEPFRVVLPYLSQSMGREVWVGVRFLRAYDANDLVARRRNVRKTQKKRGPANVNDQARQMVEIDNTLDDNLEKLIVNVMGVDDRAKIRQLVNRLHAQDTATIREWVKENTPGIDSTIEIDCQQCGNEFSVELPITDSFFRPSKR